MRLLDALVPRTKSSFVEPPFWAHDANLLEHPFWTSWGLKPDRERIENDFESYVQGAYKACGILFAVIATRLYVFSEAEFLWQPREDGRPGDLFGDAELALLERPWPNGTTGELLARMEIDASLAGNFYATTADDLGRIGNASRGGSGRRIVRMRPDWVTLIMGSVSGDPLALDARVLAYEYLPKPATIGRERKPVLLLPGEVCHYSPLPDPEAAYRGMSWLTPVLREIQADKAATKHKLKFFENAATPNLAVKLPKEVTPEQFAQFVELMDEEHKGVANAYKTLYTGGGADVAVIGADMRQLDFKATQGAGETRVAAAGRVHPVIVGLSEGMQGSSLNSGNAAVAKRLFGDGTLRPLWRTASASLETLLVRPRSSVRLWYNTRDIAFFREDAKDIAEIHKINANSISQYVMQGFEPQSAVDAVLSDDISLLKHTGLVSVQLLPPGTVGNAALNGSANGSRNGQQALPVG